MNDLIIAIIIAFALTSEVTAQAKKQPTGFEKLWKDLFQQDGKTTKKPARRKPQTEKSVSPKRPLPVPTPIPRPTPSRGADGSYIVDAQWMARYWEMELAWA